MNMAKHMQHGVDSFQSLRVTAGNNKNDVKDCQTAKWQMILSLI